MNADLNRHFSEETWEEYALRRLPEEDSRLMEEHLLLCSRCQDALARVDEYVAAAKAALSFLAGQ